MNWADTTFVMSPLVCALSAGTVAAEQKMGWAPWIFVLGGSVIGLGVGLITRRLGVLLLVVGGKQSRGIVSFGLLLAYMFVPIAIMVGAFVGTAWLSGWVARHFA